LLVYTRLWGRSFYIQVQTKPISREKSVYTTSSNKTSNWWSLKPESEGLTFEEENNSQDNIGSSISFHDESSLPPPPPVDFPHYNDNNSNHRNPSSVDERNHEASKLVSPLTNYYLGNNSESHSFKVDDFPPPPFFLLDLKDSFLEASQRSNNSDENCLIKNLPPPANAVLSVINNSNKPQKTSFNKSRHGDNLSGKPPPPQPPRRSATTKLSFSGKTRKWSCHLLSSCIYKFLLIYAPSIIQHIHFVGFLNVQ